MKDTTLFGGMRGQESSGPEGGKGQVDTVIAYPNGKDAFTADVGYLPGAAPVFDFHAFSHSAEFAQIVSGSMDLLLGQKYLGIPGAAGVVQ